MWKKDNRDIDSIYGVLWDCGFTFTGAIKYGQYNIPIKDDHKLRVLYSDKLNGDGFPEVDVYFSDDITFGYLENTELEDIIPCTSLRSGERNYEIGRCDKIVCIDPIKRVDKVIKDFSPMWTDRNIALLHCRGEGVVSQLAQWTLENIHV
jgi:hypothetical protein